MIAESTTQTERDSLRRPVECPRCGSKDMLVLEVKEMWRPRREAHMPLYGAVGRQVICCFRCLAKNSLVWPAPREAGKAKEKVCMKGNDPEDRQVEAPEIKGSSV